LAYGALALVRRIARRTQHIFAVLIFAIVSISLTAASRTIFVNYFSREKSAAI